MRRRIAVLVALAGCSFTDGAATNGGGGAGQPDAPPIRDDAPRALDAFEFLDAPKVNGSITVTPAALPDGDVTLSNGTLDWAHWGMTSATSFDHASGSDLISDIAVTGATAEEIIDITATASWTGGTPDASASQTGTGEGVNNPGVMTFTAAAGVTSHTLVLYLGGRDSNGKLEVSLSDASASPVSDSGFSGAGAYHGMYTIVYNAASDGQKLTVSWTNLTPGGQYAMIMSATLK